MFLPSFFFTLVLALHCVAAQTIFRNGNTQVAVTKIRLGVDFANPGVNGDIPADATKGLSVSTNIIAPADAPAIAQVIANANAQTDPAAKKAGLADATNRLKGLKPIGLNPTATWQAQFSDTKFPGFALKPDGNKDPGHSLLVVTTPISKDTIQATLNDGRFTKLSPDAVFSMVLALGGNPKANIQPAGGSGSPTNPATPPVQPGAAPVKPGALPVKPAAPPVKPGTPTVQPATGPNKPAVRPPTVPKPGVGKTRRSPEEEERIGRPSILSLFPPNLFPPQPSSTNTPPVVPPIDAPSVVVPAHIPPRPLTEFFPAVRPNGLPIRPDTPPALRMRRTGSPPQLYLQETANMFRPSFFFTLVLALYCVDARPIFIGGGPLPQSTVTPDATPTKAPTRDPLEFPPFGVPVNPPTGTPPIFPPIDIPVKPPTGPPPVFPPIVKPPTGPPIGVPVKPPTGTPPVFPPNGIPVRPPTESPPVFPPIGSPIQPPPSVPSVKPRMPQLQPNGRPITGDIPVKPGPPIEPPIPGRTPAEQGSGTPSPPKRRFQLGQAIQQLGQVILCRILP
ncbi:hypothetical protein DL96DRAFT_1706329 [Flagelloscypha sp. PMI_526]|nr:hypothetical protein DL96DRAFT_1706329 [Flagelloscypha sp. PMI_526]